MYTNELYEWAFGPNYKQFSWKERRILWNERHGDLMWFNGREDLGNSLESIRFYFCRRKLKGSNNEASDELNRANEELSTEIAVLENTLEYRGAIIQELKKKNKELQEKIEEHKQKHSKLQNQNERLNDLLIAERSIKNIFKPPLNCLDPGMCTYIYQ